MIKFPIYGKILRIIPTTKQFLSMGLTHEQGDLNINHSKATINYSQINPLIFVHMFFPLNVGISPTIPQNWIPAFPMLRTKPSSARRRTEAKRSAWGSLEQAASLGVRGWDLDRDLFWSFWSDFSGVCPAMCIDYHGFYDRDLDDTFWIGMWMDVAFFVMIFTRIEAARSVKVIGHSLKYYGYIWSLMLEIMTCVGLPVGKHRYLVINHQFRVSQWDV